MNRISSILYEREDAVQEVLVTGPSGEIDSSHLEIFGARSAYGQSGFNWQEKGQAPQSAEAYVLDIPGLGKVETGMIAASDHPPMDALGVCPLGDLGDAIFVADGVSYNPKTNQWCEHSALAAHEVVEALSSVANNGMKFEDFGGFMNFVSLKLAALMENQTGEKSSFDRQISLQMALISKPDNNGNRKAYFSSFGKGNVGQSRVVRADGSRADLDPKLGYNSTNFGVGSYKDVDFEPVSLKPGYSIVMATDGLSQRQFRQVIDSQTTVKEQQVADADLAKNLASTLNRVVVGKDPRDDISYLSLTVK